MRFKSIDYLKIGSDKQVAAYDAISKLNILVTLEQYDATLVGTIPIGIDVSTSDLDIICEVNDFNAFEKLILEHYSCYNQFHHMKHKDLITANFLYEGFEFEIYASNIPVEEKNSYRHMVIEERILALLGNQFKQSVIKLKESGIKTEPAFAMLLDLKGNPYDALLKVDTMTDKQIIQMYVKR